MPKKNGNKHNEEASASLKSEPLVTSEESEESEVEIFEQQQSSEEPLEPRHSATKPDDDKTSYLSAISSYVRRIRSNDDTPLDIEAARRETETKREEEARLKNRNCEAERNMNKLLARTSPVASLALSTGDVMLGTKGIFFAAGIITTNATQLIFNAYLSCRKGEHSTDRALGTIAALANLLLGSLMFTVGMTLLGLRLGSLDDDAWIVPLQVIQGCFLGAIATVYAIEIGYFKVTNSEATTDDNDTGAEHTATPSLY